MNRPRTERGERKAATTQTRPRTVLADRERVTNRQRGYSPVLGRGGVTTGGSSEVVKRPHTAADIPVGPFAQCERVRQLHREPTRCPSLEPSPAAKRYKAPPWQKHAAAPLVPFLVGPGYILSRGKNRYDVSKAGTCGLELSPEVEEQHRMQAEAQRESLIAQLQQQISDLHLFLEEERLNHRQTKQKAEEYLRDRLEQLQAQHMQHAREVKAKHKEEELKQKTQLQSEFDEFQTNTENHIRKLSKEVEHLQGAFEAYKSGLQDEMHDSWLALERRLKKQCDDAVKAATLEMKTQLAKDKAADRTEAVKEQRRTIETLRKEHKKDMDSVLRKFSREAAEMERLQKTTAELIEVKKEVEDMKVKYQDKSDQLTTATRHLTDMKVRLMDFEQRFQEKVGEVNDKYRHKLHDLMGHNSHLRLLYVDKCGQLFDEQANASTRIMQQVKAAKAAMESLASLHHNPFHKDSDPAHSLAKRPRPSSAPGTPHEKRTVETNPFQDGEEGVFRTARDIIPPEDPETERPRQESPDGV